LWLRPVSVLGAAVFTPQVAATLSLMVSPDDRATAVTSAFVGWSLASVLGMPVGNLLADGLSWRASFAAVGLLGLAAAYTAWRAFPAGLKVAPLSLRSWGDVLGTARLRWILVATTAWCAGHFTVVGYITAALREGLTAIPVMQALLMVLMGATGLAGNIVLSRSVARIGADRGARVSLALVFSGLLMWTVAYSLFATLWAVALAMLVWGLGMFAFNSSQQARLAQSAPTLASASIALNSSSLYAGQALGAAMGAALVGAYGYDALGPTAVAVVGLAIGCSLLADRSRSKV
jgi:predicted MFS family arabinose efflux permease